MYNNGFDEYATECFREETTDWDCLELPESHVLHDVLEGVKNDTKMPAELFLIAELCIIDIFCEEEKCLYKDYVSDIEKLNDELYSITYLSEAKDIMRRICKILVDGYAEFAEYTESSDVCDSYQDMLDYQKDPYAYYGLSRSDFM